MSGLKLIPYSYFHPPHPYPSLVRLDIQIALLISIVLLLLVYPFAFHFAVILLHYIDCTPNEQSINTVTCYLSNILGTCVFV